ncbi:hypothetical protein I2494_04190 [Budviciaceae bacterium BWR-B9]|uniref:Uncharacterized protein n=1 Tax=Limnobaculum allomyrinae TaxID=2791986 RepID=A0ABS1IMF3_9GAMM|nr:MULTISPECIES: hypothetical protein [Limnobaculum]MBK5142923.1 hypothetical protein [Limnobaculum allomyrinae]MBV7690190.1 hypothetical protein [Limnobaculum sp. M2-1]
MISSPSISHALVIAISAGIRVKEVYESVSKVEMVIYMSSVLTLDVRRVIEREEPSLRYWSTEETPDNPASEGFICDEYHVGISFPK